MRVSLLQRHREEQFARAGAAPASLLAPTGARIVLGGTGRTGALAEPVRPAADSLFGPRGAVMAGAQGPLFVSDTGHHRVLGWRSRPCEDHIPADFALGQRDFSGEGRNGGGAVGRDTLNVPTGIAADDDVLALADAWNHRVLLWHGIPQTNRPPDVVLGQADFTSGLANRGAAAPRADTLNWCYGVALCAGRLIVADTGNRRVLVWNAIPRSNGVPADFVLGQSDFATRDVDAGGMRWPHAAVVEAKSLFVADAGSSRIMVWRRLPQTTGAPCDLVLGQADLGGIDHNHGAWDPSAATLNMPYGIAASLSHLVVADTANSRLVGYDFAAIEMGAPADRLAGQHNFFEKGENRWERPGRDGLCWPYGVSICAETAIIADSGNNRVLLWEVA